MAPALLTSLPPLPSLSAAASYELTVKPYLDMLPALADASMLALRSKAPLHSLLALYAETNPLVTATGLAFSMMPFFFVASEISRNWSQVDRVWGILPVVFNGHFALWDRVTSAPDKAFSRVDLAASVLVLWGVSASTTARPQRADAQLDTPHVQLLAPWGLQDRLGGLPVGDHPQVHWQRRLLPAEHLLHLICANRTSIPPPRSLLTSTTDRQSSCSTSRSPFHPTCCSSRSALLVLPRPQWTWRSPAASCRWSR